MKTIKAFALLAAVIALPLSLSSLSNFGSPSCEKADLNPDHAIPPCPCKLPLDLDEFTFVQPF
jgi:hypothetical protein